MYKSSDSFIYNLECNDLQQVPLIKKIVLFSNAYETIHLMF